MTTVVVILDLEDLTLHLLSRQHLVTRCGIGPLWRCQVGPELTLRSRAKQLCTSCFMLS